MTLRERYAMTTQGEWRVGDGSEASLHHGDYAIVAKESDHEEPFVLATANPNYDLSLDIALMVAMRNALPFLLDAVSAAEKMHALLVCEDEVNCAFGRIMCGACRAMTEYQAARSSLGVL